jgi:hypothetical protein
MIMDCQPKVPSGFDNRLGHRNIVAARAWITAGVIMHEDDR